MENRIFPVFNVDLFSDLNSFIDFWDKFYVYEYLDEYQELKSLNSFTRQDLQRLLYIQPHFSFEDSGDIKMLSDEELSQFNKLKINFEVLEFYNVFNEFPTLYKLFLLHIVEPDMPLFDSWVYAAYRVVCGDEPKKLDLRDSFQFAAYKEYTSFFLSIKGTYKSFTIYRALSSFGKIMLQYPNFLNVQIN